MRWQDTLLRKCYEVMPQGGEVRIQFSPRKLNKVVPIIRSYPNNQIICEEVEIAED